MTLLSKTSWFVKTGGWFFQILWPSQKTSTLPDKIPMVPSGWTFGIELLDPIDHSRDWSPKFKTGLWVHFTTVSSKFFANCMNIFPKPEVQTVILRFWMCLYLNWFKSYYTNAKKQKKRKNAKNEKTLHKSQVFFTKLKTAICQSQILEISL